MKTLVYAFALVSCLTACGGGGGATSDSNGTQDQKQRASQDLQQTDSYSFYTKILPQTTAEQARLNASGSLRQTPRNAYLISTPDQLKSFNRILNQSDALSLDDLATHAYFLILASGCNSGSQLAALEEGAEQVTIKIRRQEPAGISSCASTTTASFHMFKANKLHAPETLFESIPTQSSYSSGPREEVIRDANAWAALWNEHHRTQSPVPAVPAIDFSQNVVVAVYLGSRPNGCYGVSIDRIYQSEEKNIVEYSEYPPSKEDICTQAITFPSHLVVAPRTPYPFEFIKSVRN